MALLDTEIIRTLCPCPTQSLSKPNFIDLQDLQLVMALIHCLVQPFVLFVFIVKIMKVKAHSYRNKRWLLVLKFPFFHRLLKWVLRKRQSLLLRLCLHLLASCISIVVNHLKYFWKRQHSLQRKLSQDLEQEKQTQLNLNEFICGLWFLFCSLAMILQEL